jgi:hypothetical protein
VSPPDALDALLLRGGMVRAAVCGGGMEEGVGNVELDRWVFYG